MLKACHAAWLFFTMSHSRFAGLEVTRFSSVGCYSLPCREKAARRVAECEMDEIHSKWAKRSRDEVARRVQDRLWREGDEEMVNRVLKGWTKKKQRAKREHAKAIAEKRLRQRKYWEASERHRLKLERKWMIDADNQSYDREDADAEREEEADAERWRIIYQFVWSRVDVKREELQEAEYWRAMYTSAWARLTDVKKEEPADDDRNGLVEVTGHAVKEEPTDDDSNGLVEVAAGVVFDVGAMCDDEALRDDTWEPTYGDDDNGPVAISMGMVGDAGAMCGVEVERGTTEA